MTKPLNEQLLEKIRDYSYSKGLNPIIVDKNQCYVMVIQALYLILVELKNISSNLGTGLNSSKDNDR